MRAARCALLVALAAGPARAQTFAPPVTVGTASGPNCVLSADVDGDGDLDLLVAEYGASSVACLPRTAAGTYGPAVVLATGIVGAWNLRAADLDGDQDLDVLVNAYAGGEVHWIRNEGGGAWTSQVLASGLGPLGAIDLLDADLDGDLDSYSACYGKDLVAELRNGGSGSFAYSGLFAGQLDGAWALAGSDLDQNGRPDLLVAAWEDGRLYFLPGDGVGGFKPPLVLDTGQSGISSLVEADMDGDGDPDILSANRITGRVTWHENSGAAGPLPEHVVSVTGEAYWAEPADFDADGDLDVVSASYAGAFIRWTPNLGAGAFGPSETIGSLIYTPRYVGAGDLDADGDLDVVTASYSTGTVHTIENLTQAKVPDLVAATGLHCVEQGTVLLTGANLAGLQAWVDGVPAAVLQSSPGSATLLLAPSVPGGTSDLLLATAFGQSAWPDALRRFPVLTVPATVGLGEAVPVTLDNGGSGAWFLGLSGALTAGPLALPGWYHGLELDGVWLVGAGAFDPAAPVRTLLFPGTTSAAMLGVPVHLQALTTQPDLGHAGFTAVVTVTVQ